MKKVILLGEETNLLTNIRRNDNIEIINFKKYHFSNDNIIYQLEEEKKIDKINIMADLSEKLHENLWGLFITLDFLKRKNVEIDKLIFPYFPYSRSNHEHKNHTLSLFTIIKYLNNYIIGKIITFDPHFENQKLPFKNKFKIIKQEHIFESILNKKLIKNSLIIGPDKGSQQRIDELKNKFKISGFALNKIRIGHNEKVTISIKDFQTEKIRNSNYVTIFDDEICSGDTILKTINIINKINKNLIVDIFVTHNFLKYFDNGILKNVRVMHTTNSVNNLISHSKIKKIDIAKIIVEEIND